MTAATLGTSTEARFMCIENEDMARGVQSYANDLKFLLLETSVSDNNATASMTVNLWSEAGIKRLLGIKGWRHSTADSVIVTDNPTVTVNNGIATILTSASNNTHKRVVLLIGV